MDLKNICLEIAEKNNIKAIGLFGSRARGDFYEGSDYDIFMIADMDLDTELTIEYELEKLIGESVDLIKLTEATDKIFLKNVMNEAIVFLNKDNSYDNLYKFVEDFFIENSDFIKLRERDLIG